ncbi:hypothetical protein BDQ17DRAFT_1395296 [Cyathus striatus]|nr:hypothetical protein BDQ17DRAFT_1395296 [Cyathus striatus]
MPFTADFPRADIHELLAPNLLHQLIKGMFKDHLVDWVVKYVNITYDKREAKRILDQIDKQIDLVPPFPGLCNFHQGHKFKQWTGDDFKALMKVFLPAIARLVPDQMVHSLFLFLEFCYFVCHSIIDEQTLTKIDNIVKDFHHECDIFIETGCRDSGIISLPQQHSMVHYHWLIQQFGAPNGLCSSITESKHIKALSAFCVKLQSCGIIPRTLAMISTPPTLPNDKTADDGNEEEADDSGIRLDGDVRLPGQPVAGYPKTLDCLGLVLNMSRLTEYVHWFLYDQLYPEADIMGMEVNLDDCPDVNPHTTVNVFHSAIFLFYAPSDLSGIGGMCHMIIHAKPSWRHGNPRHDCVYVRKDQDYSGFQGFNAAQIHIFLSFTYNGVEYRCALVHWFETYGSSPCGNTVSSIIHIDTILFYGDNFVPHDMTDSDSLHAFALYFVNKYADHHSHEIAF